MSKFRISFRRLTERSLGPKNYEVFVDAEWETDAVQFAVDEFMSKYPDTEICNFDVRSKFVK